MLGVVLLLAALAQPVAAGAVNPGAAGDGCSVKLTQQLSASACVINATYGCTADDSKQMYTKDGCRGVFSCDGNADIHCSSNGGPTRCNCTPPHENRSLISRTFGSHMVLQREPAVAVVWGHVGTGESVKVALDGDPMTLHATPDASGTWRVQLPPTPAGGPHTLTVQASTGAAQTLTDVLFGDVYVCGGQSNSK